MIDLGSHNLLGVRIDAVDYEAAVARIMDAASANRPLGVSALAVHGVMTGVFDATHRYRLNALELVVPDGQPVRWAMNLLSRCSLPQRVYGPTLMLETCRRAAEEGAPIFLFGSSEQILKSLVEQLRMRFPDLQIAGTRASVFRKLSREERDEVVAEIRASGARITFVGLGCPRQEVWTFEFRETLSMPVLAVGAAFDFHSGMLSQAPSWMQHRGLEWLYRLKCEPRRLWKRYLLLNPIYVCLVMAQAIGLWTLDPATGRHPHEEMRNG